MDITMINRTTLDIVVVCVNVLSITPGTVGEFEVISNPLVIKAGEKGHAITYDNVQKTSQIVTIIDTDSIQAGDSEYPLPFFISNLFCLVNGGFGIAVCYRIDMRSIDVIENAIKREIE